MFGTRIFRNRRVPKHWQDRRGSWDRLIFRDVAARNEYRLPKVFPADSVVIDIGAHIGSFSYAALVRGAQMVLAYEAEPSNFDLLAANLAPYAGRALARHAAVWNWLEKDAVLYSARGPGNNTGGGGVFTETGAPVRTLGLDEVLAEARQHSGLDRVRLLKLDCEGSEYPILSNADLSTVDAICAELHDGVCWRGRTWRGPDLLPIINAAGFDHQLKRIAERQWLLRAKKKSSAQGAAASQL